MTTMLSAPEQSRACHPDEEGYVERDGVRVFWERSGDGEPTVLLLPAWSIVHSRQWKAQVPYLAHHYRVVTFDGRARRSDRPPPPSLRDGQGRPAMPYWTHRHRAGGARGLRGEAWAVELRDLAERVLGAA